MKKEKETFKRGDITLSNIHKSCLFSFLERYIRKSDGKKMIAIYSIPDEKIYNFFYNSKEWTRLVEE